MRPFILGEIGSIVWEFSSFHSKENANPHYSYSIGSEKCVGVESPSPSYLLFSETRNAGYGIKEVLYHNSSCFTFGSMKWFLSRQGLVYDAEKERFIRESLETAILPLFLQNCTEPDLKELELLIEKQKACFTGLKPLEFIALDNQFHQRFFELAGQDLSWDVVASTNPHYNRLRVLTVQNAATFDGAVRQHEVMMDQIRRRDIDALRRELTDHVRKIIAEKNVLLQLYPDYFATAQQEMKL